MMRAASDRHATPASHAWPAVSARQIAVAVLVVLAAAVAGRMLQELTRGGAPTAPEAGRAVTLGPVSLDVPLGWVPARSGASEVPGLSTGAVAFATAPGLEALGIVSAEPPDAAALVAAPLRAILRGPLGAPRRVTLAGMPAWEYGELAVSGDRTMEVTVAPTTAGVVTVTCIAPTYAWVAADGCASGMSRSASDRAHWLEPRSDLALALALPTALRELSAGRAELRAGLRAAATPRAQAGAARALASLYGAIASDLRPVAPPAGTGARLVSDLLATEAAYGRLGAAALAHDRSAYGAARKTIAQADERLSEDDRPLEGSAAAKARPSVTSSAYSRSPPTGRPEARRVTATSGARSWRPPAMCSAVASPVVVGLVARTTSVTGTSAPAIRA